MIQDSTKAKGLVTQEYIAKQSPGQTLLNPSTTSPASTSPRIDPYGSSGGNLRIRGFDGNRVSVTFDGVPLNDSGNYAIFPNQLLDPELIEQINVNLGATDVDSPTASAAGGTVNFRSIIPSNTFGVLSDASPATFDFQRVFGMVQTGEIGPWGTKAWLAASLQQYDMWRGDGKIKKWQVNGKIYQPLGNGGDFVSIAGHYNQNRNNNYNNPNLTDLGLSSERSVVPDGNPTRQFPVEVGDYSSDQWHAIDSIAYHRAFAATPAFAERRRAGHRTTRLHPGTDARRQLAFRDNGPSQPGRHQPTRRADQPIEHRQHPRPVPLHARRRPDPDGRPDATSMCLPTAAARARARGDGQTAFARRRRPPGVDLNGDGDFTDSVLVGRPSITNTNRGTVISSLVWRPEPAQHLPCRLHLRPGASPPDRRIFVHGRPVQPDEPVLRTERHADHHRGGHHSCRTATAPRSRF